MYQCIIRLCQDTFADLYGSHQALWSMKQMPILLRTAGKQRECDSRVFGLDISQTTAVRTVRTLGCLQCCGMIVLIQELLFSALQTEDTTANQSLPYAVTGHQFI